MTFFRNSIGDHTQKLLTHETRIMKKNQRPRSISRGRAPLLKLVSGRNSIGEKMGKCLFFELTCMPEGIENFDQWNQWWGTVY